MRRHISVKNFFYTLLFTFILSSIISTLILTVFLTVNYINSITSTIKKANQQLLSQTNFAIDQMDENVGRLASSFLTNSHIMAYLYSLDIESTIPVLTANDLKKQLLALPYVESVYLFNGTNGYIYSSKTGYQTSLSDFEDPGAATLLKDRNFLSSGAKRPVPGSKDPRTGAVKTISYYFPMDSSDGLNDIIVINISISSLTDSIDSLKRLTAASGSGFILLDENKSFLTGIVSGSMEDDGNWLSCALQTISSREEPDNSFVKINGSYYFQVSTSNNRYGWYLLQYVSAKDIFQDVVFTTLTGFLLFLCVLGISFLFCMYFSRRLNTPVQSLLSHNQQLSTLQRKTRYSRIQNFLNRLLENNSLDSPDQTRQQLGHLGLSYLEGEKLCMAVFKIDNYRQFLSLQNPEDLWAVRFSAVNIMEELASTAFPCNEFS